MIRKIYTVLLYCLTPWILFRLFLKGRHLKGYRQRWQERFMVFNPMFSRQTVDLWVHAVSLGEVVASVPFIQQLLEQKYSVLVTTMTPSGSAEVQRRFGSTVLHQYLPYDYPYAIKRFLNYYRPKVGVIMETELWPNLIVIAHRQGLPLLLANARLSVQSMQYYRPLRCFFKPILACFDAIFAQSEQDKAFFLELGAPNDRVSMVGNVKFDTLCVVDKPQRPDPWNRRIIWLLASTHEGEERLLLQAFFKLKQQYPELMLVIAPRHPERFDKVYELCLSSTDSVQRRSVDAMGASECDIFLLDTLGELVSFYGVCDLAFVGGSLVPIGGHNVLEPIAQHKPVMCGPYMQNSQNIVEALLAAHALLQVNDLHSCIQAVECLLNPSYRQQQVAHAAALLNKHRGVVRHYMAWVAHYL